MTKKEIKEVLKKAKRVNSAREKSQLKIKLIDGIDNNNHRDEIERVFVDYVRGNASLDPVAQYIESLRSLNQLITTK